MKKRLLLCFGVGKGALAVNLLACLLFCLLASALVVGMEGVCVLLAGLACGFTHLFDIPMALCLTRYLLLF